MSDDRGGWIKCVLMWDWHTLQLTGYPGWELENGKPLYVDLTIAQGKDKSSRDIAIEFDDIATGSFYYRDWTDSGLPFVDKGDVYKSAFWFQLRADMETFRSLYCKGL